MLGKTTKLHAHTHTHTHTHTHNLMLWYVQYTEASAILCCCAYWVATCLPTFRYNISGRHVAKRRQKPSTFARQHRRKRRSQLHCRGNLKYRDVNWNWPFTLQKARWGSGGINPFFHNLGCSWRCVAGFKPQLLYRWGRIPRCTLNRRLWRRSISGLCQPFAWRNWGNPQMLHSCPSHDLNPCPPVCYPPDQQQCTYSSINGTDIAVYKPTSFIIDKYRASLLECLWTW